jgi:NMD protein affecting ribosome stability and mRNA decay
LWDMNHEWWHDKKNAPTKNSIKIAWPPRTKSGAQEKIWHASKSMNHKLLVIMKTMYHKFEVPQILVPYSFAWNKDSTQLNVPKHVVQNRERIEQVPVQQSIVEQVLQ